MFYISSSCTGAKREWLVSLHKHMVALFWGRFVTAVSEWLPRLWQLSYSWVAELPKSMNINTAIQIPCNTRALDSQTASPKKLSVTTFVCSGGGSVHLFGAFCLLFLQLLEVFILEPTYTIEADCLWSKVVQDSGFQQLQSLCGE